MPAFFGDTKYQVVSATDSAATSEPIDKKGYAMGSVFNEGNSSAVVITWYAMKAPGSTPRAAEDETGTAITQTIGDNECQALHVALAGYPILVPVTDVAAATLYVHLER